jgi:hypothetical protein
MDYVEKENGADIGAAMGVDDDYESNEIVLRVRNDIKAYKAHAKQWRQDAKMAYNMYAGKQWTTEEVQILEEQGRPPITFNKMTKIINTVTGLELQNRQDINCIPFGVEDQGVCDLANNALKYIRKECEAEDVESEAYEDVLVCGLGGVYTYVDYEIDRDGCIVEERIDPFMLAFDPTSRKKNAEDSKWRAIERRMDKKDFITLFPQAKDAVNNGTLELMDDVEEAVGDPKDDYKNNVITQTSDKGKISVIYYQCYKLVPVFRVENPVLDIMGNPTGEMRVDELNEEQYEQIKTQIEQAGLMVVEQVKRQYHQYIVAGDLLLDEKPAPVEKFSIEILTGLRDRNANTWFGLVKLMMDPQRWANKWLSQIMHILNTNAKGGFLYETGSFKDPTQAENDMSRPDKNVEVNPGKLERIQPKPQPNYPDGIDRLLQYAMGAINDTSGVPLELMGLTDKVQAGVVEESRKNSGLTTLAQFTNSLRKFRKFQGKLLLDFAKTYIADGRLIRIDEKNGSKYIPLLKEGLAEKYDIIIDDAPNSVSVKERVFGTMMQLLPMAMQAGVPIPPDVLDYSPLPANLIESWKNYIAQQSADPMKQAASQLELQKKTNEIKKIESDAFLNMAKAQDITTKSQIEAMLGQTNIQDNMINLNIEKIKQQTAKIKAFADIKKATTQTDTAVVNAMSKSTNNGGV